MSANKDALAPHSDEAEQGILGCILLAPSESMAECVLKLRPGAEAFFSLKHRAIYEAMLDRYNEGSAIDTITITQDLRDLLQLDKVGGMQYIASLPDMTPSAANLEHYIQIVIDKFLLRKMISTCRQAIDQAMANPTDVPQFIDQVEHRLEQVIESSQNTETIHSAAELLPQTEQLISKFQESQSQLDGLPTGLVDVDKLIGGLHDSDMIVIAARPSCGKTSLGLNIAEHVAVDCGIPVAFYSLEMTASQLMFRMICGRSQVNMNTLKKGELEDQSFQKLGQANLQIAPSPLFIDDEAGVTIMQLKAKARRMVHHHGIRLIIIDYLQLLQATGRRWSNRQEEVSHISNGIKSLAKELCLPIVVLAQLNRELDKGGNRKPRMSDLRESGSIEQDADVIGMLYKGDSKVEDDSGTPTFLEVIHFTLAKHRNGQTGDTKLAFFRPYTKFGCMTK